MNDVDAVLDLSKPDWEGPPLILRAGEIRSMTVRAAVTDMGEPFDLAGYAVYAEFMGDGWHKSVPCSASGAVATFEVPPECSDGPVSAAYVSLEKVGFRATTGDFPLLVLAGKEEPCAPGNSYWI